MRIAICDDQEAHLGLLQEGCRRWGESRGENVQVLGFSSGDAFLFAYEKEKQLDVLLLDIQMPGLSGMDLARKLRERRDSLTLALITAIPDFALEGYQVDALAYLVKPVSDKALFALLDKVKARSRRPFLLVEHNNGTVRLDASKILYLESQGHNTKILFGKGEFWSPHVLSYFEALLEEQFPGQFHRCHRCYLINLAHTASIYKKEVLLEENHRIPVARGRFEPLSRAYGAYYRSILQGQGLRP